MPIDYDFEVIKSKANAGKKYKKNYQKVIN